MNSDSYHESSKHLRGVVATILEAFPSVSTQSAQEFVYEYLEHDEPQLAYSNLVALIVKSDDAIDSDLHKRILDLGKDLSMGDGTVWDEREAKEWWEKLKQKTVAAG